MQLLPDHVCSLELVSSDVLHLCGVGYGLLPKRTVNSAISYYGLLILGNLEWVID